MQWNCWKRSFAGDSTVPSVTQVLDAGTWQRGLVNQSSFKLNEHGPALNVFWSRRSGMGAGGEVNDFAAGRKQVKANHAPKNRPTKALDEAGPQGYSESAYKTSRRGVALAPALSVQGG
jgi:hypothetical protein